MVMEKMKDRGNATIYRLAGRWCSLCLHLANASSTTEVELAVASVRESPKPNGVGKELGPGRQFFDIYSPGQRRNGALAVDSCPL